MSALVIDTDVVSFLFKENQFASRYRAHVADHTAVISFMTRAELYGWAEEYNWGAARRTRLELHLEQYVHYDSSRLLCYEWSRVITLARRNGRPISEADAWQAALAIYLGVPLVSHNRRHYVGVPGLTLISEAHPPGS